MNIAVLIAVEEYQADGIGNVIFAENDSQQFSAAIANIGFDETDQQLLVNELATKTSIESVLRTTIKSLTASDKFFLYYTGHAFSENAESYLTCHGTRGEDLTGTSIRLQDIFALLRDSHCTETAVFLDACESEIAANDESKDILEGLATEEISKFFDGGEAGVCFVSCQAGEKSWASKSKGHRAWAFNVLEAFRGNAVAALDRGNLLTPNSLQSYLEEAVQRTLRSEYSDKKDQSPWMCGASEFVLADLNELIQGEKLANPNASQMTRVSFIGESLGKVNGLSGFVKGQHRVPDKFDDYTDGFTRDVASEDVEKELKDTYRLIRAAFGFKRLDLDQSGAENGCGSIITPYFTYETEVRLNPDNPKEVIYEYRVTDIKEPEQIFSDEFSDAFDGVFDTIEFTAPNSFNVEDLIDRIETIDDERLQVDFDSECTQCTISVDGLQAKLEAEDGTFRLSTKNKAKPRQIVEKFFEAQQALVNTFDVRIIEFDDK